MLYETIQFYVNSHSFDNGQLYRFGNETQAMTVDNAFFAYMTHNIFDAIMNEIYEGANVRGLVLDFRTAEYSRDRIRWSPLATPVIRIFVRDYLTPVNATQRIPNQPFYSTPPPLDEEIESPVPLQWDDDEVILDI